MTSIEKIKINRTLPTTLLYKGGNCLGKEITNSLIDQGGFVIVIDELSDSNIANYKEHIDSNLFLFVDFVGLDELKNELERLDYIIYIDDIEKDVSEKIGTDFFLKSSNDLNKVLKLSLHFKSKFVLASSLKVHQILLNMQSAEYKSRNSLEYNRAELQRYSESLVKEFIDKASLNARIVRVAELVGEGAPLNIPSELVRLCKLAINGKPLNLIGDGLQSNYLVSVKDAAFGLLKSLFEDKTKGKIYSICYPQEITSLSLAYKITELEEKSGQIVFDNSNDTSLQPVNFETSTNLSEIGWSPKINIERAISQEIEWINSYYGGRKKVTDKKEYVEMEPMKPKETHVVDKPLVENKKKEFKLSKSSGSEDNFIKKLSEVTKSKSRNSKIVLSDKLLRDKLKEKEIKEHKEFDRTTFSYKFNYWIRTLTFTRIMSYFFIFLLSFILYFIIISPVSRSLLNVYKLNTLSNNMSVLVTESDLSKLSQSSSALVTDLENSKFVFDIFRLNDLHNNLRNNLNIVKEYTSNAISVSQKYSNVKNYLNSKQVDILLSQNEYSDLKKLAIANDKLLKDTLKISPTRIEQLDNPVNTVKSIIENQYLKPSIDYINFEEDTTLLNAYEQNIGYLVLYYSTDTNKNKVVSGYSYFNNQDLKSSTIVQGKFEDKFKLTPELKTSLDTLLVKPDLTSSEKKSKIGNLLEYFNSTLSLKVDTILAIDYEYNPNLVGDSKVEYNSLELDSIKALDKIRELTDMTERIALSSKITQNYLSRTVLFSKLSDYLDLFKVGIQKTSIYLFTNRGI
ncbi:MAG: NAD-dependent epimerase/dehydratase family protein [bacterium]